MARLDSYTPTSFVGQQVRRLNGTLYESVAAVQLARIGSDVTSISTAGYYSAGDGGGALYKRATSEPSHGLKIQSADGAWWEFAETVVSVLQAGAVGDGTTEDVAAFNRARDWYPTGTEGTVIIPVKPGQSTTLYKITNGFLDATTGSGTRIITSIIDPRATFTGGVPFTTRRVYDNPIAREERIRGTPAANSVLGNYRLILNSSASTVGYGERLDYTNSGAPTTGFDLSQGRVCNWQGMAGGTGMVHWDIYHTPNSNTWTGAFNWIEVNPVNRGPDMGWANTCGVQSRWMAGIRFVPESQDFTGEGGTGRHVLVAYTIARSGSNNADGVRTRTYNGYMVEPDSIAPDGYAAYFNGSTSATASEWPVAMLGGQETWEYGAKLNGCTFGVGNLAILLGTSHVIGWADASNVVSTTIRTGTGSPEGVVTANVGSLFLRTDGGASTTLYVKTSGTGNTGWTAK